MWTTLLLILVCKTPEFLDKHFWFGWSIILLETGTLRILLLIVGNYIISFYKKCKFWSVLCWLTFKEISFQVALVVVVFKFWSPWKKQVKQVIAVLTATKTRKTTNLGEVLLFYSIALDLIWNEIALILFTV